MLGSADACVCPSHTHHAVTSLCSLDKYASVSNVRAHIGVKQGFLSGLQTGSCSGLCIPSMLADLRGDIAVLEGEYTKLVNTMEGQRTAVPVVCEPDVCPSLHRSSPTSPLSTGDFDRSLVMSDIHSRISIKEGTMLGLKASASSDASVVRGVTMQIAGLEHMYTDLTRELCVHHRKHLTHSRNAGGALAGACLTRIRIMG